MFRHTGLFLTYELKNTARNPIWPLFGILQPVLWLLLFAPLLANVVPGVPQADTLKQFTPGVLVMLALFSSLFVGFATVAEIRSGVLERLAVSPASRPAIILGRTVRDTIVLLLQALLLLGVATLMGMRASLPGVALMLVLMAAIGVFASSLSYALALSIRDENGLSQTLNFFSMPILLLTGIILPMVLAPRWMRIVAEANPFYHAVEAGRSLFAGDFANGSVGVAFGFLIVLALLTVRWSVASMRRVAE